MSHDVPVVFENVPSPFCGIISDDLKVMVSGFEVKVLENGDPVSTAGFEAPISDLRPRVKGNEVSLDMAIEVAAEHLGNARLPVFSGFGTDVNETRAALSLIDRCRGIFDQARAEAGLRNLLVLADSGWVTTTLAEIKNRVDVLVVFGSDPEASFPRFFERFIWPNETLFGGNPREREVIYVGRSPSGAASFSPDGREPWVLPSEPEHYPDIAAVLAALALGQQVNVQSAGGIPIDALKTVIKKLRSAHYGVVSWVAGQLDIPHAELTVQQLTRMVTSLNTETRCAGFPLGGQNGDRTASQACAWLSGYPTRVSYAKGYPEYDPYHNSAERLIKNGEADLFVWVSSLSVEPPPAHDIPTVVLGRSGMQFQKEPDVFIPVAVPGIDFRGHQFRCDNVVSMPLLKLRDSPLPLTSVVLQQIERRMDSGSRMGHLNPPNGS